MIEFVFSARWPLLASPVVAFLYEFGGERTRGREEDDKEAAFSTVCPLKTGHSYIESVHRSVGVSTKKNGDPLRIQSLWLPPHSAVEVANTLHRNPMIDRCCNE